MTEVRCQRTDDRRQMTDDGGQKSGAVIGYSLLVIGHILWGSDLRRQITEKRFLFIKIG